MEILCITFEFRIKIEELNLQKIRHRVHIQRRHDLDLREIQQAESSQFRLTNKEVKKSRFR